MTEIPEHLRRRAEDARNRAAENSIPAHLQQSPSKIPAHLLARAEAARNIREPGLERGQHDIVSARSHRKIPFAHTTPGQYNLMVAQIRRIFHYGSVTGPVDITPSERVLFTIQNPGTWVLVASICIVGLLVWAFTAA